ncbi:MAG TPA: PGPGW domain-containing protein [Candidatus Eisenbacteria bacterium]|nr:PGPGW domain-containing protein [Candidatus Eisenbacteria bacterium]
MLKHTVRAGRVVVGLVLLIVGCILSLPLVPGPGLLLVVVALSVLSHEFEWARRLRNWAHAEYERLSRRRHAG